jgi:hypothetical protein
VNKLLIKQAQEEKKSGFLHPPSTVRITRHGFSLDHEEALPPNESSPWGV